jgi:hypothetical protein
MIDWNIQSRSHGCQACEKRFEDKQPYHTLLFWEKGEYTRQDICDPCWQVQYGAGSIDRKGFISFWKGVYVAPPAVAPDPIQKENAETILRKLIELNDPKHGPACYILAVMLERKRVLKVKEQIKKEGTRVFIYEHPATGDIFTITDPNLQLNQLDEVQRDVAYLMEHGSNPPPPETPAAPSSADANAEAAPAGENPAPEPEAVSDAAPVATA